MNIERRLLGVTELCQRYGISRRTVANLVKSGKLPKPVQLLPGKNLWRAVDLEEWEKTLC